MEKCLSQDAQGAVAEAVEVMVLPDGKMQFICSPTLGGLLDAGPATIKRASHVEPVHRAWRVVFHLLRRCSRDVPGNNSLTARMARKLPGPWQANMAPVAGPMLGPFDNRQSALDAEVQYLKTYVM